MSTRHTAHTHTPGKELVAAVINQAIADAGPKEIVPYTSYNDYGHEVDVKQSARHFLDSGDRDAWFDMLGIEVPWEYGEGAYQEYVEEAMAEN